MGVTPSRTDFWNSLTHEGVVISPVVLPEFLDAVCGKDGELPEPKFWHIRDLRTRWTRFGKEPDAQRLEFVDHVLSSLLGHGSSFLKRGAQELPPWAKVSTASGKTLTPDRLLLHNGKPALLVRVDATAALGKYGGGRRNAAEFVQLLRRTSCPVGVFTNGSQWRLVWAGPDADAWVQWEAEAWIGEGDHATAALRGFLALLGPKAVTAVADEDLPLHLAVRESRSRQGELSRRLGEQVRQAVERLLARAKGSIPDDAQLGSLYQAATRVVMRLVVLFFAESERRHLLPRAEANYGESYSLEGLLAQLRRARDECGAELLGERHAAWPRLLSLFRLVYFGADLGPTPIRAYGGELFRPGDLASSDPILRELAHLESPSADISDREVLHLLESLKYTEMRVGKRGKPIPAPVDFGDLSTEYIGILYEGLLDYELRKVSADDEAVIGLVPGKDTYLLPLRRLRSLSDKDLLDLLNKLSKKQKAKAATEEEESAEEDSDDVEAADEPDDEVEEEVKEDSETTEQQDPIYDPGDVRDRVLAWARSTVQLWKRPEKEATRLVPLNTIFAPGEFYLVRWGGTRKGSGTFYTPPALAEPTVRRTLQPLCWQEDGKPRTPEEILALRVLDPACGSGSFLVSALRYLTDAYVAALEARISTAEGGRPCFPFGRVSQAALDENLIELEDGELTEKARNRAKRFVAQRCLFGVDLNPLAVELCRVALWVETLDQDLPFEFFSHHVKCGNALVGAWLDQIEDYPLAAWDREMGDGTKGERRKALKEVRKEHVLPELKAHLEHEITARGTGAVEAGRHQEAVQSVLFTPRAEPPKRAVVEEAVARLRELEAIGPERAEERERYWIEQVRDHPHLVSLREAYDRWCAVWFWSWEAAQRHGWPTPAAFHDAPTRLAAPVAQLHQDSRLRFFHWELEFPEVFCREAERRGFDAVVGNPPWDVQKPNSQEFFSNEDPIYRTYGKQQALAKQQEYFAADPQVEQRWLDYSAGFKAFSRWVGQVANPYEGSIARGKAGEELRRSWELLRSRRESILPSPHSFRYQGSADLNLYKLFLEQSWRLLREGGRMGMLVPSGIYTDKGSTDLRTLYLDAGSWEWVYGFENRGKIFDIDSRFKFCPVIVAKDSAHPTEALRCAFMRHDLADWAAIDPPHIIVPKDRILHFAPGTRSLMEFRSKRDIEICEKIYHGRPLLGDRVASGWQVEFATEFHMTNDSHLFTSRRELERLGLIRSGEDARDPRVRERIEQAGYAVLVEGRQIWHHWPFFAEPRKWIHAAGLSPTRDGIYCRKVARNTDARTLIVSVVPGLSFPTDAATELRLPRERNRNLFECIYGSLILDYVLRMKTSSNILAFVLESLPSADDPHTRPLEPLAELVVTARLAGRVEHAIALCQFEGILAQVIGLSAAEFEHVLRSFPALDDGLLTPGGFQAGCLAAFHGTDLVIDVNILRNSVVWWSPPHGHAFTDCQNATPANG